MRFLAIVLAAAVIAPGIAAAAEQPRSERQRRVCRTVQETGTRIRSPRVCQTQEEWDRITEEAREDLGKFQERDNPQNLSGVPR